MTDPADSATRPRARTIAVLTTGRQDWGILHSTCAALRQHPDLELRLLVGGMHLADRYGHTVDQVRADGFEPAAELDWLGRDDPPASEQAARALAAIGATLEAAPPDALLIVGDRFETAAGALAATLARVPIAHLHGGEQTAGSFDDQLRHAITKLSHLHLVSDPEHARRVERLGEDPATIHVVGAPGLDAARRADLADRSELETALGIPLDRAPLVLVTIQPVTLDADPAGIARPIIAAMDRVPATYVMTLPNADPGAAAIRAAVLAASGGERRVAVEALGERRYWGLMRIADAMLGNTSSALIEAPAFGLPAVDVGDRQAGRARGPNVIHAEADATAIATALRRAIDPETRAQVRGTRDPLADGHVGQRIVDIISGWHPAIPPRKAPIDVSG